LKTEKNERLVYIKCNLEDKSQVITLFARYKFIQVIHTAALLPDGKDDYLTRAINANILATAFIAESAIKCGCNQIIFCSSTSIYGFLPCGERGWDETARVNSSTVYGWSKLSGEDCLRLASLESSLKAVSLRLSGIHGFDRKGGVIFHMANAAKLGKPITVNNPNSFFQFIFVEDVVEIILELLQNGFTESHVSLNIAGYKIKMRDLANRILMLANSRSEIEEGSSDGFENVMITDQMKSKLKFRAPNINLGLQKIINSIY
jgi:nucleoside-diphosphate-sugar epimerase